MMVGKIFYQPLKTRLRPLARVLAFVLVSPPLSAFASTPIDSEVRNEIQWYAFAAYSEVYEVPPPPHLASMAAHVIEEENWSLDTPVSYHLVNYLLAFEQVDASASSDVIKAVYLSLFDEIAPAIAPNAEPDADTITYAYDDLHRLLTSSITGAANGDNVGRTYTYSAIGNILTASDQGTYLYENTNYANPHAVTKVGTAVYGYDNNGNLTGDGTWTHGWEYDNRLKQSVNGGTTVSYSYDHSGQRVKLVNGSSTTRYANKLYNSDGTKNVKHIYAGSQLVATLENTTLQYIHTDHLTGSNVATNNSGTLVQLLDYYPYGSMRIDQTTTYDEQRKFTGHEFDRSTNLTYANARYYKQNIGRFLSQDPAFIFVAHDLSDPQSFNAYAYSRNNPLRYVDPDGKKAVDYASGSGGYAVGFAQGFGRVIVNTIAHPIQTAQSIGQTMADGVFGSIDLARDLSQNSGGTLQEIQSGLAIQYQEFESRSYYEQGKSVGNLFGAAAGNATLAKGAEAGASLSVGVKASPVIERAYQRPPNATTAAQKASVQGHSCTNCGRVEPKMYADHIEPLVKEYYRTGTVDLQKMHDVTSVQPNCPTCSSRQGGELSNYSKEMKQQYGF